MQGKERSLHIGMNKLTQKYLNISSDDITETLVSKVFYELTDILNYHNKLYYEQAKSIISDGEYDKLFQLLVSLEKRFPNKILATSPTRRIWQSTLSESFTKAEHLVPLISLENSYEAQDLRDRDIWLRRIWDKEWIESWTYVVEPKLDWSSVELIYAYGQLSQAITRWDWKTWEDITQNVKMIRNVPLYVKWFSHIEEIRVRGEILLPKNMFDSINNELAQNNENLFANPRNAAAWTLRQLDSNVVYKRGLVIFIYDLLYSSKNLGIDKHEDLLDILSEVWVPIFPRKRICADIESVIQLCDVSTNKLLQDENVEMDGLVVKVNELWYRDIFWSTEHHPKRAIAYKFPTKQVAAKLIDITYQVWRTWVITPVAELDPVSLGWVTVSRATLHNFEYISDRDIRKGDWVWIQRSGEVIPYIIGPIQERRDWMEGIIQPLESCPSCNTTLVSTDKLVAIVCPNDDCKAKLAQQLQHFVSKNCLNIAWLWNSLIETFVDSGYLHSISDIFDLPTKTFELKSLPWIWEKKLITIFEELDKSKSKELWRWIHGFGIKYVGKKISQDLVQWMENWSGSVANSWWDYLLAYFLDSEYLDSVFGLGKQTIESLEQRSQKSSTLKLIHNLEKYWVLFDPQVSRKKNDSSILLWKKFVITGTFEWYSRDVLSNIISSNAGEVLSTVSKNTDYLLCGTKAWSKLLKAQELDIKILGLGELSALLWDISLSEKKSASADQGSLFE